MLINQYDYPLILASRSPRRQALLSQIGVPFELLDIEIDESVKANEKPLEYVERMAKHKAQFAWSSKERLAFIDAENRAVLTADTSVIYGDVILGKPESLQQAISMLTELSGNTHQVITSVALASKQGIKQATTITHVDMAKLTKQQITDYCKQGEGVDKAGGYAIQGLAAQFISSIKGSYSSVVGLPLYETSLLLNTHYQTKINQ